MVERLYPLAHLIARTTALIGGLILVVLVGVTVVSIIMRNAGLGPIPGDFEIVEAGVAAAIFAFMPWCQLERGHARVEILAGKLGRGVNNLIDFLADLALLIVWIFLAYRHYLGMSDKQSYGETTFILQFPIWWAYLASLIGMLIIILVAIYCVMRSWRHLITGTRAETKGAAH